MLYKIKSVFILTSVFTAVFLFSTGCSNKTEYETTRVQTWASLQSYVPDGVKYPPAEYTLPEKFYPWTGTVSHHQLTDKLIDDWFYQIKIRRSVRNFYIITPSHYGLSTQEYSVANCEWYCGKDGSVETNTELAEKVCKQLGVTFENEVFPVEHGASCLMPYIKKYFPKAKVIVIAVNGEPPINMPYVQKLNEGLSGFFTKKSRKKDFLIISSDFSHHSPLEETLAKDSHTLIFMNNPTPVNFLACVCDNRAGIYVMANNLMQPAKAHILYHTNAYYLCGQDELDITSYYFTLFE